MTPTEHVTRPRVEGERETEILQATLEVLAEVGYDLLTMDAVASRAKASKATLYRRWKGKPELVVAAVTCHHSATGTVPDTGSLGRPMIGQNALDSCQRRIDAGLHAAGVDPMYVFRTNDNGAVQAMVRAGIGASVMPLLAVDVDDEGVRVLEPSPALPMRDVELVWRRGRTRTAAARRFVELAVAG